MKLPDDLKVGDEIDLDFCILEAISDDAGRIGFLVKPPPADRRTDRPSRGGRARPSPPPPSRS